MPIRVVEAFDRIRWPQAIVLIAFLASVVCALVWTPAHLIERAAAADWRAIGGVIIGFLTAIGGIVGGPLFRSSSARATRQRSRRIEQARRDLDAEEEVDDDRRSDPTRPNSPNAIERMDRPPGDSPPPPRHRRNGSAGSSGGEPMLVVIFAAVVVACACLASGCGASPLRQHATAAHLVMVTLEGAGQAIELGTDRALARCPDEDGAAREACVLEAGAMATRAAAARDALIPGAHAYRAAVKASDGEESPGLVEYLAIVAASVSPDWPAFARAMQAFGIPVPVVLFPTEVSDGS